LCICAAGTVEIGATCFDAGIFAAIVVSVAAVIIVVCTFFYLQHRRAKSDEVWQVKVDELHFGQKAEVIGQGSFGVVLLAEYRGTKVAIKRVLPVGGGTGSRHGSMSKAHKTSSTMAKGSGTGSKESLERGTGSFTGSLIKAQRRRASQESGETGSSDEKSCSDDEDRDIETGMGGTRSSVDPDVVGSICSDDDDFGFLGHLSYGRQKTKWERLLPNWMYNGSGVDQYNASILGTASASTYSRTVSQRICPWFTEDYHRKQEFIQEMRLLSRLRHPCITTVMGATVQHGRQEPMMVMEYMENGSLYDLLQNETLHISGDLIVQIFRDVSQGMRFLHASKPPILHGDLKAKNILVDSRFRAKVADFGLSKKTVGNLSGTPYWLAPEYLRGKTDYNASCDVYSFGKLNPKMSICR
jgi:serine/threonine protein kinase